MKTRIISLLTALTLCLFMFTACSENTNTESSDPTLADNNRNNTVLFMTEDGNFCYLSDLSGNAEAKILVPNSETTDNAIFPLDWDYYPSPSDPSHYWFSDDGKYFYFVTEGKSSYSPLYVSDANGEKTELVCDKVRISSVTPIKNGLVFQVDAESDDDTLYSCFDGKATKLAEDVDTFGANKNSNGIYFIRKNPDVEGNPYAIFYVPADGSSSPKIICESIDRKYSMIFFGNTRDMVLYTGINDENANEKTYSIMMSENGNEPKLLIDDSSSSVNAVYDDTFFYEKYTKTKYDHTSWHTSYFDGSKSIDLTENELDFTDISPYVVDREDHTYFFFNGSADNPQNPEHSFNLFNCIYKGKYIGDVHTYADYLHNALFISDSEFVLTSKDADENDTLESYKLSTDTPAVGTIIADDPFAVKYVESENAIYFMSNTLDDGEYDSDEPAKLMCYKDGKCETVTDDVYQDLTRVYEDGTVLTFKGEERNTLIQYKNGKEEKIGDNIYAYLRLDDGSLLFSSDKILYLYKNGEQTRLAENVKRFYSNAGDYGIN